MSSFQNAKRELDNEIDTVAAQLIRNGTPPYRAFERAMDIVSRRRQSNHQKNVFAEWIKAVRKEEELNEMPFNPKDHTD